MRVREYILVVRRRWWMIVLATLMAGITAYSLARNQQPTYRSSVKLEVTGRIDYGQLLAIDKLLRQLAARVTTTTVAEAVSQRLQLDLGADALLGKLHTQAFTDTLHIQIDVDDADPTRAERIAGAFADVVQERQAAAMASIPIQERVNVSMLDKPKPGRLFAPQARSLVLAGALLGLLVGLVLVFLLDYADETFRGAIDVQHSLGLPVVGVVPSLSPPSRRGGGDGAPTPPNAPLSRGSESAKRTTLPHKGGGRERKSVSNDRSGTNNLRQLETVARPMSAVAEAYRTVAVNLRFGGADPRPKTILFTSAGRDDGKTLATASVAVAIAQGNAQVVLVDADLRRPTLHEIFGVANTLGLTTLANSPSPEMLVHETEIHGLKLVTGGPPPANPTEVLSSPAVTQLIEQLRADADLVLVDSAPVTFAAETSLLAARMDGVILVVDGRRTRRQDARRAKEQLERVNARILGVLLHNARMDREG